MTAPSFAAILALPITAFGVTASVAADFSLADTPEFVRVCDAFGGSYYYIPGVEACIPIYGFVIIQSQLDWVDPDASGTGETVRLPGLITVPADQFPSYVHLGPATPDNPWQGVIRVTRSFGDYSTTGNVEPRQEAPQEEANGLTQEATRIYQMFNSGEGDASHALPHTQPRQEVPRDPKSEGPTRATIDTNGNGKVSFNTEMWQRDFRSYYVPFNGGLWPDNGTIILTFPGRDYGSGIISLDAVYEYVKYDNDHPALSILEDTSLPAGATMSAKDIVIDKNRYVRTVWAVPPSLSFDVGKSLELRFEGSYSYDWGGRAQPAGPSIMKTIALSAEPLPHASLSLPLSEGGEKVAPR